MAVSKVILNGNTLIDTTDKTVTDASMLSGVTALKNDGTTATGNIATKTSADLSVSGATVTAPAGHYASAVSASVASGTAGTPTATKGTVSNHAVTVTPSVTNTTGYITGSTKTGTAVTVTAAELESGTLEITQNGTGISVSGYSAVDVAVNGGGGGVEYETGTYTPASDIARLTIYFENSHTDKPAFIVMSDTSSASTSAENDNVVWSYNNPYGLFGVGFPYDPSTVKGSYIGWARRTSANILSTAITPSVSDTSWVSSASFFAYTQSSTYVWRAGRTYKWAAVWLAIT